MRKAGIRELKTHLSKYLSRVKRGEQIIITERGTAIAEILPVGISEDKTKARRSLAELAEKGLIILPPDIPTDQNQLPQNGYKIKGKPVSEIVIENRR